MTDQQALHQYATSQDPQAFRALVEQYQRLVYTAARRRLARVQDIEDVVQVTFFKLARAAGAVRHDLASWLYTTAVNTANELIRRDATRRRHEAVAAADSPSSYDADQEECHELSLLIDQALLDLPRDQQSLLIEHFFCGRSQRDLAEELHTSQSTVMRRITAAIDELRTHLADLGYVAATPILASTLQSLPHAEVPVHVTAELAKIGLAGASSAPVAISSLPAFLTLKLTLVAAAIVVVATGTLFLIVSKPPTSPALAAPATNPAAVPASAPADPADWRTTFNNAYALRPDQNLKFIAPAHFPPERQKYFAEIEHDDTPMPCIQWRWMGGKLKRQWMAASGPEGAPLSRILQFCAGLDEHHASTAGIPPVSCDGDWIVRDGAPTDAILADLHTILVEQFRTGMRFEKTEVTKDALVVAGKYQFHRLAEATGRDLQIFADVLDHPLPGDSIQGGGTAVPAELWMLLGQELAIPIVDDTTNEPAKISWLLSRSITGADQEPARRQQILDNITKQTGITFKQEKRPFLTWKLTSAPAATPPASSPAR